MSNNAAPQSIQPTNPDVRQHTPTPWRLCETGNIGSAIEAQTGRKMHEFDDGYRIIATYQGGCASEFCAEQEANRIANGLLIVEAVNSYASLTARVEELTEELSEWKQAASVEAGLRREFSAQVGELESEEYLVWSNQHRAWWRQNSCGYTSDIRSAGRYPRDEAISISGQSRDGWGKPTDLPDELAIPISALPKNIRAALSSGGADR